MKFKHTTGTTVSARARIVVLAVAAMLTFPASAQTTPPIITTLAGGGTGTGNGDGGPATQARVIEPVGVAVDGQGNVFVLERYGFKVRRIDRFGVITTVAGNGQQLYNGDNQAATSAGMDPRGIAADLAGNLYIADGANDRIRKVAPNGMISSIASKGFGSPSRVAVNRSGTVFAIDGTRIWRINASGGLELFAGTGGYGTTGDGGPATQATFSNPNSIAFDRAGNAYVTEVGERVRRIDTAGIITSVAGGGPFRIDPVALAYRWPAPQGVAVDSRGGIFVASFNNTVRVISTDGIAADAVSRVVDQGGMIAGAAEGFSGDGGPAVDALLWQPQAVAIDEQDILYVADTRNHRVRKVTPVPAPRTPAGKAAFAPAATYAVGSFTKHLAIADITGDGRNDVIVVTSGWPSRPEPQNDYRAHLFVQQANGTLARAGSRTYAADTTGGRTGSGLDTADLNGDGFDDLVIGTLSGITVYLGSASGLREGLSYNSQFIGAESAGSVTILDADRDGRLDIVTFSAGRAAGGTHADDREGLVIFYGNGAGGIARQTFQARPSNVGWAYMRSADMNNDGYPDLTSGWAAVLAEGRVGGFEVTLNNAVNGFGSVTQLRPTQLNNWGPGFATGDFNGDGRKDAIVAYEFNTPSGAYALMHQQPNGSYVEARTWLAYDNPTEMLGADMNGDGRDDFLVLHGGWDALGYFQQTEGGQLDEEYKFFFNDSGGYDRYVMDVGDLNGDGCKDVAIADYNYGLNVMAGQRCSPRVRGNGAAPLIPGVVNGMGLAMQSSWVLQRPVSSASPRRLALNSPARTSVDATRNQRSAVNARKPFLRAWAGWALLGFGIAAAGMFTLGRRTG